MKVLMMQVRLMFAIALYLMSSTSAIADYRCEWTLSNWKCAACSGISQAYFRDFDRRCVPCSGFCWSFGLKTPATPDSTKMDQKRAPQSDTAFVKNQATDLSSLNAKRMVTDEQYIFSDDVLSQIAVINPAAVADLRLIDRRPELPIDLAHGRSYSDSIHTAVSVQLLAAGADSDVIVESKLPIEEGRGLRVEWNFKDTIHGTAVGIVSAEIVEQDGRVVRKAYPSIRVVLATQPRISFVSWHIVTE